MELENDFNPASRLPRASWKTDDEALAYYLSTARYGGGTRSPSVEAEMEAIVRAARADPAFAARVEAMARRLDALDGDAAGQTFEQLMAPGVKVQNRRTNIQDRAPAGRHRRGVTGLAIASPLVALVLAVLVIPGAPPEFAEYARVDPVPLERQSAVLLRGGGGPQHEVVDLKVRLAHELLTNAENRMFGRLIGYDEGKLTGALALLEEVVVMTSPDDPRYAVAQYLFAKGSLSLGQLDEARARLRLAAAGSGQYAIASRALLDRLDAGKPR